ncbi:molybdenum cofactor guanylyltransferase [bacterium]|nr:molybdenum cofactor guanylyltransferase [bacterium]
MSPHQLNHTDFGISILAGGQGSRLGYVNKATLKLGSITMLERMLEVVRPITDNITLMTKQRHDYSRYGIQVCQDALEQQSPLVGLYSALLHSTAKYELILAVDLPYLTTALLTSLLERRHQTEIVIPYWGDHWEPLCAVYSTDLRDRMHDLIQQQKLCPLDLLEQANYLIVQENDLASFGDPVHLFTNINTLADLALIGD